MVSLMVWQLLFACGNSEKEADDVISYILDDSCNPLSIDGDCYLPFPSTHFTTPDSTSATGVHLNYDTELFSNPGGITNFDLSMFNIADGVSPLSPAFVNFTVDIDPSFLSGAGAQEETIVASNSIVLINTSTGELVPILTEMDQANRNLEDYSTRHPLIIRPLAPMNFGAKYAVVLRNDLQDVDGNPLPRSAVFDLFQSGQKTDNAFVESMRPRYEELFTFLETAGWERDDILLTWEFQVASEDFVLSPVRQVKDMVLSQDASEFEFEVTKLEEAPNDHLSWYLEGDFYPPNVLTTENELAFDSNGDLVEQAERFAYSFHIAVPKKALEEGNLKLVLIGHGLFGRGEGMLKPGDPDSVLHVMAEELGAVLIATDWIGLSSGDRDLILEEVLPDLNRVRVITDRLVQSHGNNLALVEMALTSLTSSEVISVNHEQPLVDPEQVFYYGISLGGIQGAGQTVLSDRITRSVLAVPGAGWANLIQRSTQFQPLEVMFDSLYPDPITQSLLLSMVQGFFDWSDPGNLSQLDNYDGKTIVLQEAIGDCQVSNITTDLLSRAMGASHLETATDPLFDLETVSSPYQNGVALTQIRVPEDLAEFFPPDANVTPEVDNGVHNSAVLRESIFNQIFHLYETGELIHPCDGECDAD